MAAFEQRRVYLTMSMVTIDHGLGAYLHTWRLLRTCLLEVLKAACNLNVDQRYKR